jgi:hypothetical protein
MKPYIQVIWKDGRKESMHDVDDFCDYTVHFDSEHFSLFVEIVDGKMSYHEFNFDTEKTVEICSRCFGRTLREFVYATIGLNIGALLNELEVHDAEGEEMGNLISEIDNRMFKEKSYYLRLTQQQDDKWVLSFVFWGGEAVSSEPTEWPDFSLVWKEEF